jgi:hypothetical protein
LAEKEGEKAEEKVFSPGGRRYSPAADTWRNYDFDFPGLQGFFGSQISH